MDQPPKDRPPVYDWEARLDRELKYEATSWLIIGTVIVCVGILTALGFFGFFIHNEIAREIAWQHRYGAGWRSEYEKTFGALSTARVKIAAAFFGAVIVPAVIIWIIKLCWPRRRHQHN